MSKVHSFRAKVKSEDDWDYPGALVSVRLYTKSSQETGVSHDGEADYVVEFNVEAIAYSGSYHQTTQAQAEGKSSRPLINTNTDEDPDLFKVDLEHTQSIQVINGALSPIDKMFRLIELDVTRRFA